MISRANRFHGQASLRRMQQHSKTVRGNVLALKYAPNPRRHQYRLAIVVSRKVSKSAVVRNRIRRRLYENVRILSNEFTTVHDLVLIVYDEQPANLPSLQLTKATRELFQKARLTAAPSPKHGIVEERRKN